MQNERLTRTLIEIGLPENVAKLYITMLHAGPSSILRISKQSGIKRTTIYSLIEQLKNLGLARVDIVGSKQVFVAEPPSKLEAVLVTRKHLLDKHLPEFEKLVHTGAGSSFLKYYEGLPAVKSIYEDILTEVKKNDDYLVFSNQELWESLDISYFTKFQERRARLPIKIRMILQDSESARRSHIFQRNINAEIKLLPKGVELSTNLVIIPRKIVMHQLKSPTLAIVIENQSVIQMHREMFEIMWQTLPK